MLGEKIDKALFGYQGKACTEELVKTWEFFYHGMKNRYNSYHVIHSLSHNHLGLTIFFITCDSRSVSKHHSLFSSPLNYTFLVGQSYLWKHQTAKYKYPHLALLMFHFELLYFCKFFGPILVNEGFLSWPTSECQLFFREPWSQQFCLSHIHIFLSTPTSISQGKQEGSSYKNTQFLQISMFT